ncbi:MlaA family lipoprotein [Hahella ganghwensis]|uniref:MlaA family lipoprotein n=1 Tax=Hahella ganghwensis TaxID=286420 RepID=UPI000366F14E|nr:VacJ family lipoprotein [Hahella ganghwensis]
MKFCNTLGLLVVGLLSSTPLAAAYEHPDDPWESVNRKIYSFNDTLDQWILRPVAKAYRFVTPGAVDRSITNFFNNLSDVPHLANNLLQLKGRESAITFSRLVYNTTFGLGGLIDIATEWDLPVQEEDFGQTLNYYGVPEGSYLVLPFLGPATVSDAIGKIPDSLFNPIVHIFDAPESYYATGVKIVDIRADLIPTENLLTGDKYAGLRNVYLQRRDYLINDGKIEDGFLDDDEDLSDF